MRKREPHDRLTTEQIAAFGDYLRTEEREQSTIDKYLRNVRVFALWLDGAPVTKSAVIVWEHLLAERYAPATLNAALASLNAFFKFTGWEECRVKALRLQRRVFRDPGRELTRNEYDHLVSTAYESGRTRLGLLMETICATRIRVSEVKYITAETYARKFGSLCVPYSYVTANGVKLGKWLATLKAQRKRKGEGWYLTGERQYRVAQTYYREHGHLRIAPGYVTPDGTTRRLEAVGMIWDAAF